MIQAVKLPTRMVTGLLSPFDKNELELWNVEFWRLKKPVKTLQIGLYCKYANLACTLI